MKPFFTNFSSRSINCRVLMSWMILLVVSVNIAFAHEEVDELFLKYKKEEGPGASIGVFHNGKIIFEKSYGLSNIETESHNSKHTNFRLASLTKQFTAMSIMICKEKNFLSYEDTLDRFFPNFPDYGQKITVRHLLNHTSGLKDYEEHIPKSQSINLTDQDILNMLANLDATYFPAGSKFKYSNSGYAVLAMIVEKVSGISFHDFIQKHIFHPLGMKNSIVFKDNQNTVPFRALGYSWSNKDEKWYLADQNITSSILGDGCAYSSVSDYFLWDIALYSNPLVSKLNQELMFTPGTLNDGSISGPYDNSGYGFGWVVSEYKGRKMYSHRGSTTGFRNIIMRFPNDMFTVIVLCNDADAEPVKIAQKLTDFFLFEGGVSMKAPS